MIEVIIGFNQQFIATEDFPRKFYMFSLSNQMHKFSSLYKLSRRWRINASCVHTTKLLTEFSMQRIPSFSNLWVVINALHFTNTFNYWYLFSFMTLFSLVSFSKEIKKKLSKVKRISSNKYRQIQPLIFKI